MTTPALRRREDHDLIVEMKTEMKIGMAAMRDDIRELKDGTTTKIVDHEMRLREVKEVTIPEIKNKLSAYAGGLLVIQFITGIILWYFSK